MFEIPLHAGTEHTALTWVVLSSLITFVAGLGLGTYSEQFRKVVRTLATGARE